MKNRCYSKWGVNSVSILPTGAVITTFRCTTCGYILQNHTAPTCVIDSFYSRRAAVKMGSINKALWRRRIELAKALAKQKSGIQKDLHLFEVLRAEIKRLMREKRSPDKHYDLVQWDAQMKREAEKNPHLF